MTIQDFIEKAVEGGWKGMTSEKQFALEDGMCGDILLDPEAWKAVGKVMGSKKQAGDLFMEVNYLGSQEFEWLWDWKLAMHRMIDALTEGKTIESFLETL